MIPQDILQILSILVKDGMRRSLLPLYTNASLIICLLRASKTCWVLFNVHKTMNILVKINMKPRVRLKVLRKLMKDVITRL